MPNQQTLKESIARLNALRFAQRLQKGDSSGLLLDEINRLIDFVKTIPKGDVGYSPKKGKDYFTPLEINDISDRIQKIVESRIRKPNDGRTPVPGRDYPNQSQMDNRAREIFAQEYQPLLEKIKTFNPIFGTDYFTPQQIDLIIHRVQSSVQNKFDEIFKKLQELESEERQEKEKIIVATVPEIIINRANQSSSSAPSPGTTNFADNETPTGALDGVNTSFALAHAPNPTASLNLILNGQYLTQGSDYTLAGSTITFASAPDAAFSGLPFKAFYRY